MYTCNKNKGACKKMNSAAARKIRNLLDMKFLIYQGVPKT